MRDIFLGIVLVTLMACGGGSPESSSTSQESAPAPAATPDDGKGVGEITTVSLNDPLNQDMVARGKGIYEMKCSACHRLTAQRVVGPGFSGVTERRQPEWIMNMITNTDAMLEQDPQAQALLEECLTRMPNQNVSVGDARDILEFLYDNDKAM
jgi:mono/diheme cytochrome c family protein